MLVPVFPPAEDPYSIPMVPPSYRPLRPLTTEQPLVSVIMFCRNRVSLIRKAVESVLHQTYTHWELVIQDGASTDGTKEAIESYHDPRIKLVSVPDDGPFDAMWKAYQRCQGEITGSCLSDEELLPNALEEGVNYLLLHPETAAIARDLYLVTREGEIIRRYDAHEFNFFDYLSISAPLALQTVLFRHEALVEIGLFTHPWKIDCADFELFTLLGRYYRIDCYPGVVGKYCQHHEGQLSTTPEIGFFCAVGQLGLISNYFLSDPRINLLRSFPLKLAHAAILSLYQMKGAKEWEEKLNLYFDSLDLQQVTDLLPAAQQAVTIGKLVIANNILAAVAPTSPDYYPAAQLIAEIFELLFQPEQALSLWSDLANQGVRGAAERFLIAQLNVPTVHPVQVLANQKRWATHFNQSNPFSISSSVRKNPLPRIAFHAANWSTLELSIQFLPLLPHFDRQHGETFCLLPPGSNPGLFPATVNQIQWSSHRADDLREILAEAGIDVLVELSGFAPGSLLTTMATRCAPVQMTYLGHAATTGLRQIDFQIADHFICPDHLTKCFTEEVIQLPGCYSCFDFSAHPLLPHSPSHRIDDRFTFGCLAPNALMNKSLLDCWARILSIVPHSRLAISNSELNYSDCRVALQNFFRRYQVPHESLLLLPCTPDTLPAPLVGSIDLYLDPFPHSHPLGVAACLTQGIPSISLAGQSVSGRLGSSLLHTAGLTHCIAHTVEEYGVLAHALARRPQELQQRRISLPPQLHPTGLTDPPRFAELFQRTLLSRVRSN